MVILGKARLLLRCDGKKVGGSKKVYSGVDPREFEDEVYERGMVVAKLENGNCADVYIYALRTA